MQEVPEVFLKFKWFRWRFECYGGSGCFEKQRRSFEGPERSSSLERSGGSGCSEDSEGVSNQFQRFRELVEDSEMLSKVSEGTRLFRTFWSLRML